MKTAEGWQDLPCNKVQRATLRQQVAPASYLPGGVGPKPDGAGWGWGRRKQRSRCGLWKKAQGVEGNLQRVKNSQEGPVVDLGKSPPLT